ncbi:MAG: nitroreductase family protein [Pseudomonadota bacterium]
MATTDSQPLYEIMRTTFAARTFTDTPVSDAQVYRILESARFAPSGGNRQGWKVVVVRSQETRDQLLPLIRPTWQRYLAQRKAGENPWNTIVPTALSPEEIEATPINEAGLLSMINAPVLLFVFVDLSVVASMDSMLDRVGLISGCSIYPFVWNILLAARNEGLGGVTTTFLAPAEAEVQALLGVPSHHALATMIPLGEPTQTLTRLRRAAVETFTTLERSDGPALTSDPDAA